MGRQTHVRILTKFTTTTIYETIYETIYRGTCMVLVSETFLFFSFFFFFFFSLDMTERMAHASHERCCSLDLRQACFV